MQTSHCFRKYRAFLFLSFISIFILVNSCGNQNELRDPKDCIKITWGQINAWLKTGANNPNNANYIPYLFFTPYVEDGRIKVDAYPVNKDTVVQYGERINMNITSRKCAFPPGLQILPNYYHFSANNFFDASGKLIKFDYLRLVPKPCPDYADKLAFDVEIVGAEELQQAALAKGETRPCPPYCPTQN